MRQIILLIIFIGTFGIYLISCEEGEKETYPEKEGKVELYLINSFLSPDDSFLIIDSSIRLKDQPLIYYKDFVSYNSTEYTFELSNRAINAIENLEHSVHGLAFAITADSKVIYSGYFWPSISSMSCDWIIMDPILLGRGNKINVRLGYPGYHEVSGIPDKRNDKRIIDVFKSDGKLVE